MVYIFIYCYITIINNILFIDTSHDTDATNGVYIYIWNMYIININNVLFIEVDKPTVEKSSNAVTLTDGMLVY